MNCFKNKNILVTGDTFSLGNELVQHLLNNEQLEIIRYLMWAGAIQFLLGDYAR